MPELVVTGDDRLVIVKDRERLGVEFLAHDVESRSDILRERPHLGVERDPDEPAMGDLAGQLFERDILLAEAILIPCFRARYVNASAEAIELPGVEHAGHVVGIARRLPHGQATRRLPQDQIAAMRADVEERAQLAVRAAHDHDRLARQRHGAEIERLGQLRLVHGYEPHFLPDLLDLFLEDAAIAVDTAVDIRYRLTVIVAHPFNQHRHGKLHCVAVAREGLRPVANAHAAFGRAPATV